MLLTHPKHKLLGVDITDQIALLIFDILHIHVGHNRVTLGLCHYNVRFRCLKGIFSLLLK